LGGEKRRKKPAARLFQGEFFSIKKIFSVRRRVYLLHIQGEKEGGQQHCPKRLTTVFGKKALTRSGRSKKKGGKERVLALFQKKRREKKKKYRCPLGGGGKDPQKNRPKTQLAEDVTWIRTKNEEKEGSSEILEVKKGKNKNLSPGGRPCHRGKNKSDKKRKKEGGT